VLFLDRLEPEMSQDKAGTRVPIEQSWNVRYFCDVMQAFGFEADYALFFNNGETTIGLSRQRVLERVAASVALINVMGFFSDGEILAAAPRRVFLDIDPGFGQMWQASGLHDTFRGHDAYATIAENIGTPECTIPTCGLPWITTRQPVVLSEWPAVNGSHATPRAITSVASWRGSYGPVDYQGTTYGLRVHEFRKFASLPRLTGDRFELALDIHPTEVRDLELLRGNGWVLIEPRTAAADPARYRDYIRSSAAELMIAKGMYVQTHSGWFSDRSACYLEAAGRCRAGHRARRRSANGHRTVDVCHARAGSGRDASDRARLRAPSPGRQTRGRRVFRLVGRPQLFDEEARLMRVSLSCR
jgi:hypothetical protein